MNPRPRHIIRIGALLVLALCATGALAQPLIGLAGMKYRRSYAPVVERLGMRAQPISGTVLEDRAALAEYDALIIVNKGDPGQEEFGLTDPAQDAVREYIRAGGRALLTYGCTPPPEIISGDFSNYGQGPHWQVADSDHPIVAGLEAGQAVQFGRYRSGIRDLGDGAEVLVRETSGHPIVFAMQFGEGALVYSGGDLGHAGNYDGTTEELRDRVLRFLVHGQVQQRFGPQLSSRGPVKQYEPVHTPRQLAAEGGSQQPTLCSLDIGAAARLQPSGGYAVRADERQQWIITAPEGRQIFAPWETIPLGRAPVQAGERYEVAAEVRLTGVSPGNFVAARFELRFYDADGAELAHANLTTDDPSPGEWQDLRVSDIAPEGAASAGLSLTVMLPGGELDVRRAVLQQVMQTEALMAAEEPLSTDVPHPRLLPEAAADFEVWVASEERGVYDASRAEIFARILKQADGYLEEPEMTFGDTVVPWPPTEIPEGEGGTAWNPMTGGISSRLTELSLAYQGTGDERYGERAVELLLAISNWPVWYDPVNDYPSLDVGRMSRGAAWAYDLCYDLMTEQQRATARQALRRNTLIPLYEALSRGHGNLNSRALWLIGFGSAAVATLGEVEGASLCTRAAEDFILEQLDIRATSHPIEGMGYDSWACGNMLTVLSALRRNFGVDHFDHPFLPVMPRFAVAFLGNDRKQQAWLEDAGGTINYVHWHYPLTILGAINRDPLAGWYLRETQSVARSAQDALKVLFFDPTTPVAGPQDADGPGRVFPKAGWASLRSGWEEGGTFIAFVCSDSGTGHAQRHQNTFLVYRDNVLMTTDPGYASGTRGALREYTRGTVGHNSVLVDNTNQMYKLGRVPHFVSGEAVDYVMGDATAAYSASLLDRFHRHLVYVKPDLLFVIDDLRAPQPRTFQWILHPNSRLHMAESVTAGGEPLEVGGEPVAGPVHVEKQGKRMRVRSLAPEGPGLRYLTFPGAEQYNPYLQIDHPAAGQAVLVNLLEFGDTTAEDVTTQVAGGEISVEFSAAGAEHQLRLRLAGEDDGPAVRVTRDGEVLLDEDDPGIPEDAVG